MGSPLLYCVRDDPLLGRAYQLLRLLLKVLRIAKKSCFDCHFRCFDQRNSASEAAHHEWSIASTDKEAALKDDSAGYFWSCIFVFFIAHRNMSYNINHWYKNTQLELFLTLLSCNYNTTISIKPIDL